MPWIIRMRLKIIDKILPKWIQIYAERRVCLVEQTDNFVAYELHFINQRMFSQSNLVHVFGYRCLLN